MSSRVVSALALAVLSSAPVRAEKLSDDFRSEFQRIVRRRTYAVVVQKGVPTVPINGMKGDQAGNATFGVDIVSPTEWRSAQGLFDSNQDVASLLEPGEILEVVDVTFKDNRVDIRTVSTEAKKIRRGAWILKTEIRETVSTNFKFFFPEEWKGRAMNREEVPAALDYISAWLVFFPDEGSARRLSAQVATGDMPRMAPGPHPMRSGAQAAPAAEKAEIKPGMTALEVVEIMGKPQKQVTFGHTEKWTYDDITVIFENGKVKDVRF